MIFARQASTRFICSLFSLPVPPGIFQGPKEDPTAFSSRSVPEYLEQGRVQKLLLFGLEGSGTSTLFKQVKFIYLLCWLPILYALREWFSNVQHFLLQCKYNVCVWLFDDVFKLHYIFCSLLFLLLFSLDACPCVWKLVRWANVHFLKSQL